MRNDWCPKCKRRGGVIKRGKTRSGKQQYYCKKCKHWSVETLGTINYYSHFSKDEIIKICEYILEGKSIRTIAEHTHHHRNTICHLFNVMASNAYELNEILPFTDYKKNLFWGRLKKRKRILTDDAKRGLNKIRKGTSRYIRKDDRPKIWIYEW